MASLRVGRRLKVLEDGRFGHILMGGDAGKNPVQSSDSEGSVRGNRDAVGRRMLSLKDDVAAYLMDFQVIPALAEVLDQFISTQIAWELHATASTSSRIR